MAAAAAMFSDYVCILSTVESHEANRKIPLKVNIIDFDNCYYNCFFFSFDIKKVNFDNFLV